LYGENRFLSRGGCLICLFVTHSSLTYGKRVPANAIYSRHLFNNNKKHSNAGKLNTFSHLRALDGFTHHFSMTFTIDTDILPLKVMLWGMCYGTQRQAGHCDMGARLFQSWSDVGSIIRLVRGIHLAYAVLHQCQLYKLGVVHLYQYFVLELRVVLFCISILYLY
jgi:hypothetical protein